MRSHINKLALLCLMFVCFLIISGNVLAQRNLILKPVTGTIGFFNGPRNAITFQSLGGGAEYLFKNMSSLRFNLAFGSIYKDPLNFYMHDFGGSYKLRKKLRTVGIRGGFILYKGMATGYAEGVNNLGLGKLDFPIKSTGVYLGLGRSNFSLYEDNVFNNMYADLFIVPTQKISPLNNPLGGSYVYDNSNKNNKVPGHIGFRVGYESCQLNRIGIGVRPELIYYPGGLACLSLNFYLASAWKTGKEDQTKTDFFVPEPEKTPEKAPEPAPKKP